MNEKSIKIRILEKTLGFMSQAILWRYKKTCVIGITGSVGKTTTKNAIVQVLKNHKSIYYTKKNHNNEIGVPLTVLGINKEIKSVFSIIKISIIFLFKIIYCKYPDVVVVELGIDRTGDMEHLMKIVNPDIAVLTAISVAHSEFFNGIAEIRDEKQKIITSLKDSGIGIINYDDGNVRSVLQKTNNEIVTYSTNEKADFVGENVETCFYNCHNTGITFKLNYKERSIPVRLNNVIAPYFVNSALAALAVADVLGINMIEAIDNISSFESEKGRMKLLKGKNDNLIIDDGYNASPKSMMAALEIFGEVNNDKKLAILGDMRELGNQSKKEHLKIGNELLRLNIRNVLLVGAEMKCVFEKLKKANVKVRHFDTSEELAKKIEEYVDVDNILLIKGSRGIHMENITRIIAMDKKQTL